MKRFIWLFLLLFLFMQKKGFSQQLHQDEKAWSQVKALEKQGLYQSAWDKARDIYAEAVNRHDDQEQIKALLYQLKYRDKIEEDAAVRNLAVVDSIEKKSSGISKAILQSMLAEMYWRYAQAHRYTLYNRVTSAAEDEQDITTWSLSHLYERIATLYKASLADPDPLKQISLDQLKTLVDPGKNALRLQPTLFDLLAHRALDYFTGEEQNVITPAEHFTIHTASAFDPALTFAHATFPGDSSDLAYHALQLYQQVIRFHLQDAKPEALIDADLQRLQFVYRKAVLLGKDSLYKMALEHIIDQYGNASAAVEANYLLAQWYYNNGRQYDAAGNQKNQYDLKKALDILNKILVFPAAAKTVSAQQLKDDILRTAIGVSAEQVNVPDQPFRVLVTYKNTKQLWFRLIKLPEDAPTVFSQRMPSLPYLLKEKAAITWEQTFPDPGDYQSHFAEMKMDALPQGRYALLVSPDAHFAKGKSPIESIIFYVSGISYIQNGEGDYLVLNRESGKPLAGATVRLWNTVFNQTKRESDIVLTDSVITDQNGVFRLEKQKNMNILPEILWHNDHLFIGQVQWMPYVSSTNNNEDTTIEKTWLFTDRSIYRPGQTVYFKGVSFNFDPLTHQSEVIKDKHTVVRLFDGNNQLVDSLQLTSNDFGSYTGSFTLPTGLLNGNMRLEANDDQATTYFSVEEYKRPTFYLQWDTAAHEYRLGDTVTIKGNVVAYSQAAIDNATVKYQVTRRTRIIFPWYRNAYRMIYPPRQSVSSIVQGVTATDANGDFKINFPALPDEEADSALNPVFIYTISLDVTDINGESHPFSYTLPLGYQSIALQLNIKNKINAAGLDTLALSTTDLSGKFTPVPVSINIYPVNAPDRYIRSRYWQQPDEFLMDKKEYLKYFPHDEYKNESDPDTWSRGALVLTQSDTTNASGAIALHGNHLSPGWYAVEVDAVDKDGHHIDATQYVQVYGEKVKEQPFTDPLWLSTNELEGEPGDKVSWLINTADSVYVSFQDEHIEKTDSITGEWLSRGVQNASLEVNKEDLGGIIRHYVAIRYNRLFKEDVKIQVPWKKKQLHIQYATFRDKLLPGTKEQWTMKVTGDDGDKVAAEMLASMYDASLDAFRPHQWQPSEIYPVIYGKVNWQDGWNFRDITSYNIFTPKRPSYESLGKIYPSLNWFGYNVKFPLVHMLLQGKVAGVNVDSRMKNNAMAMEALPESAVVGYGQAEDTAGAAADEQVLQTVPVRKNFDETAFFLPQLHTDDSGNVVFQFTVPEALTKWKLMMFAHTKDMRYALSEREAITQKQLMIQANAPRFVRQGDSLTFSAKISNTGQDNLQGKAQLELTDALTGEGLNDRFKNKIATQPFTVNAGQSAGVKWAFSVPENYTGVLSYKVVAVAGDYNDGEQNALPVLTNRVLVTESLPLYFTGNGNHKLNFTAVQQMKESKTLQPEGMTIAYTGNPVWYAVQALPFLDEGKQQSADSYFNQVYANALSDFVARQIPGFNNIMQQWLTKDSNALKSPLQQNETLKTVLLEETPWVEAAQKESAQKAKVAGWFKENGSSLHMRNAISRLADMQLTNGGFSWFKDMPDDRYMTQRIIAGIGHLKQLKALPEDGIGQLNKITQKGVPYLDARMKEAYDVLKKSKVKDPTIGAMEVQFLYMRSFFPDINMNDSIKAAYDFYKKLAVKKWTDQVPSLQAMIALAAYRSGDSTTAKAILKSLSETAIKDPVKGMHWKQSGTYYRWYQAPVEEQSVCVEAFDEINHDEATVNALKNWLLSQKQTQHWATTPATADAIYALLLTGEKWMTSSPEVTVKTGNKTFIFNDKNGDAGTQYSKVYVPGKDITPDMAKVNVQVKGAAESQPTWGALYFQYFENMNKLEQGGSDMSISREISLEKTTPEGPKLIPVTEKTMLQVGDKVQIRLVVKISQDMDYVHLKDVRAACMEPLQTISRYHWENGTGYYTTVTDAAMHYYFSHLSRGTYVFTYPVYITHAGDYTGGMSTLECLYAPGMRAHSEGVRVDVNGGR